MVLRSLLLLVLMALALAVRVCPPFSTTCVPKKTRHGAFVAAACPLVLGWAPNGLRSVLEDRLR